MATQETENKSLIDYVRSNGRSPIVTATRGSIAECKVFAVPKVDNDGVESIELESMKPFLDEYLEAPERRAGTAEVTTLASFVDHTKRFADPDSALFADDDVKAPSLTSVLDYHRAGASSDPRFGMHRAIYRFPISDEWKAWTAPREPMKQAAFGEFLEDRCIDVLDPAAVGAGTTKLATTLGLTLADPVRLLELARGLAVNVETKVAGVMNLSSGEAQISFEEKHVGQGGTALKVPTGFVIAIPVFRSGAAYQLPVRLRYRVLPNGGGIVWLFQIARIEQAFRDALAEACTKASEETGLPLFYGKPEK